MILSREQSLSILSSACGIPVSLICSNKLSRGLSSTSSKHFKVVCLFVIESKQLLE